MNLVSFGGGVNSTALIIGMHRREIPIDLIVFADTGGERPDTYEFIGMFNAWLKTNNLPEITIVQKRIGGKASTLEVHCLKYSRFPGVAYGKPDCSVQFKIVPQERFCNQHEGCRAVWEAGEKVSKFVGYDANEQRRINKNQEKYDTDKKYAYHFPLLEWGWAREDCIAAIQSAGLPLPGKSSCFFCPNNKKEEIRKLWETNPDLFDRAVALEHKARKTKKDGSLSSIIGLGRNWTWEEYRNTYLAIEAAKADQCVFPGFEEFTGGCCCGMPCGCYDG